MLNYAVPTREKAADRLNELIDAVLVSARKPLKPKVAYRKVKLVLVLE